jgi:hypothetical protein
VSREPTDYIVLFFNETDTQNSAVEIYQWIEQPLSTNQETTFNNISVNLLDSDADKYTIGDLNPNILGRVDVCCDAMIRLTSRTQTLYVQNFTVNVLGDRNRKEQMSCPRGFSAGVRCNLTHVFTHPVYPLERGFHLLNKMAEAQNKHLTTRLVYIENGDWIVIVNTGPHIIKLTYVAYHLHALRLGLYARQLKFFGYGLPLCALAFLLFTFLCWLIPWYEFYQSNYSIETRYYLNSPYCTATFLTMLRLEIWEDATVMYWERQQQRKQKKLT